MAIQDSNIMIAKRTGSELESVLPFLVLPIAIASLIKIITYGIKQTTFFEVFPMIMAQLITIYIWVCFAINQINHEIDLVSGVYKHK